MKEKEFEERWQMLFGIILAGLGIYFMTMDSLYLEKMYLMIIINLIRFLLGLFNLVFGAYLISFRGRLK